MTIEEKLKMYRDKKNFIWHIANTFIKNPAGHSVLNVTYEIWHKEDARFGHQFKEWVIVHYKGGAHSFLRASGNSNIANFQIISDVLDHGNYEATIEYNTYQIAEGYKKVDLTKLVLTEVEDA